MQNTKPENPDEKIYLDFRDENFKIDQKSFSPGSQPPGREFSKKCGQKNPKKNKKTQKSPHSYPPWGALLYYDKDDCGDNGMYC